MKALSFPVLAALGVAGVAVLLVMNKGARETGAAIGGAVVDLADGVLSGAVVGVGSAVGIPATEPSRCEAAKAANNLWDVSLYCPAADYFRQIPRSLGALF